MIEVLGTDVFEEWFLALDDTDSMAVARVVGLLEAKGTALGFPYSSAIQGTAYPLRELRIQSGGRPLRVFYAFDPLRQAVLLLGGDKTGDNRFYAIMIPKAETIWQDYLREQGFRGSGAKR
ncbi:MAG: addiction module toxin RelE [Chloroflexi bacterium]|nr:MAG: addiction module toxin RelE [Chloroflexota bacterium]